MRVRLAIALVLAAVSIAIPALAAEAPQQPARTAAPRRVTATNMHYPTLEKMLRRFSRQAGESRTRG